MTSNSFNPWLARIDQRYRLAPVRRAFVDRINKTLGSAEGRKGLRTSTGSSHGEHVALLDPSALRTHDPP